MAPLCESQSLQACGEREKATETIQRGLGSPELEPELANPPPPLPRLEGFGLNCVVLNAIVSERNNQNDHCKSLRIEASWCGHLQA